MNLKTMIPWQAKILAKILLFRIPFGYPLWKRLGLFEHGHMEQPDYAYEVFRKHYERSRHVIQRKEYVTLELGPGDTLFSAVIARGFGAASSYLVDTGPYATLVAGPYEKLAKLLIDKGYKVPVPEHGQSTEHYLESIGAKYLTHGLDSLKSIPAQSVDFIWSQAVLEHVKYKDFLSTFQELRRIIRDDGICSHRIDLKDHLGGSLNNLRFSRQIWESRIMAKSGFYTNRIRFSEMMRMFEQARFAVEVVGIERWDELPIPRRNLPEEFRSFDESDLRVSGFDVLLSPRQ